MQLDARPGLSRASAHTPECTHECLRRAEVPIDLFHIAGGGTRVAMDTLPLEASRSHERSLVLGHVNRKWIGGALKALAFISLGLATAAWILGDVRMWQTGHVLGLGALAGTLRAYRCP